MITIDIFNLQILYAIYIIYFSLHIVIQKVIAIIYNIAK
jgi:hypothetical protein